MQRPTMIPLRPVGFLVCLAVILVYFYVPTPDEMHGEDKWLLRKYFAVIQLGSVVARFGAVLGYDSVINITRSLRNSRFAYVKPDDLHEVISTDYNFDGVNVTIHRKASKSDALQPALFYIHGGGWVYEYREMYANFERYLADKLHHTVVTVDYPLAPENPYPIPFEHSLRAIKHLHANSQKYVINPEQISITGDSAGGNIAAAVALKLRDEGDFFLHRLILISPVLQFASFRLESFQENDKYGVLTKKSIITYWLRYINESQQFANELAANEHLSVPILKGKIWPYLQKYQKFPQSHVKIDEKVVKRWEKKLFDPYLCPVFAKSLSGLPKTLILVSEYDILRDEGLAFADRLRDEGVDVTSERSPGFHGIYAFFRDSKTGTGMADSVVRFLRTADGPKTDPKTKKIV